MSLIVRKNVIHPLINDYLLEKGSIGYFGYITKRFLNLQMIMPSHYSSLSYGSIFSNHFIRKKVTLKSNAISIVNNEYSNFYHFIFESLVKLFCLRNYLENSYVVFPAQYSKFHQEWFNLLDINNIIYIDMDQIVEAKNAISCNFIDSDTPVGLEVYKRFRDWVLQKIDEKSLSQKYINLPEKIFIARRGVKYRRISNFEKIEPILREFGYTIIELEHLSLLDQIHYFKSAKDIVGIHGAGFSHLIFTSANVLDIIVSDFHPPYFSILSEIFEVGYQQFRCPGVPNNYHRKSPGYLDIFVDPYELRQILISRLSLASK